MHILMISNNCGSTIFFNLRIENFFLDFKKFFYTFSVLKYTETIFNRSIEIKIEFEKDLLWLRRDFIILCSISLYEYTGRHSHANLKRLDCTDGRTSSILGYNKKATPSPKRMVITFTFSKPVNSISISCFFSLSLAPTLP